MNQYRKEVCDFIRLSETLLSPASLQTPLTEEECQVVDFTRRHWPAIVRASATYHAKIKRLSVNFSHVGAS